MEEEEVRDLIANGAITSATLLQDDAWTLRFDGPTLAAGLALDTPQGEIRRFLHVETALRLLDRCGWTGPVLLICRHPRARVT